MPTRTIRVRVVPNSKKEIVERTGEDEFVVKVREKPIHGKANKRVVELLSDYFSISKSSVRIVRGVKSRLKMIEINDENDK